MRKSVLVLFIAAIAVVGFGGSVGATDYYLAPDGNDSWSGTIDHPWKTLYNACQTLVAGDTVYLRAGTYPGYGSDYREGPTPLNSGTVGNPITFAAYPGETAIIRPIVDYAHAGFIITAHSYITIDGLEISHCSDGVRLLGGYDADNIIIKNCHIHHSNSLPRTNCGGIHVDRSNSVSDCEFSHNIIHDNVGVGVNAAGILTYDLTNNTIICGNIIYNEGTGIFLKYDTPNSNVSQNIVYNCTRGIRVTSESHYTHVHENIIYNCSAEGIQVGINVAESAPAGVVVYNNAIDNCRRGINIFNSAKDLIIYNNIISGSDDYGICVLYGQEPTIDYIGYNDVYDCGTAYYAVAEGESSIQLDPEFVNSVEHDYHLQSSSPCKGTGRYGEDMGAYPGDSGPDTLPPSCFNHQPTGTISSGTTSTNISLETDKQAICRYSTISGTNYTDMPFNFTSTNSTNHSTTVSGLENGQTYTFYVRCNSSNGYVNDDDFNITFTIDGHKVDTNDDGIINMPELMLFIVRWKAGDGVTKAEVLDARDIWFTGGVY
ncbi:MAG: right-handed parallel beta-helix repeat-containing protein [Candidatus Altiarchaeota archaeon]|nr:right-handed parallel beta-helix repeat-containing protein [Candidatus Altiarchaeota archaeon]